MLLCTLATGVAIGLLDTAEGTMSVSKGVAWVVLEEGDVDTAGCVSGWVGVGAGAVREGRFIGIAA